MGNPIDEGLDPVNGGGGYGLAYPVSGPGTFYHPPAFPPTPSTNTSTPLLSTRHAGAHTARKAAPKPAIPKNPTHSKQYLPPGIEDQLF